MKRVFSDVGSFLKTPSGVIFVATVVWHVVLWFLGVSFSYLYLGISAVILIFDFFIASYLLDRLIYFFSQFVLPIQNPKHRQEIHNRVSSFESGSRGPILFVKNGRVITHEGETNKRGPGVILLDTASSLVMRTDTEIRGAVGPGVRFTGGKEYIAGSVDLRTQWQFIGPLTSDQPFLNPVPISNPKQYNDLQARRQQTAGLTRDGFEISPTISIKFSVKRPAQKVPTESGVTSQYGFDSTAVRNAITREVIELGTFDNKRTRMDWNKLPAHLVVNLWREYVRKFKLEDLFKAEGVSGLQTIEDMINKRVRKADVVALDDTGLPTGEAMESLEFKQLQARGLEIIEVRIHNVLFDPNIEEQIVKNWSAEWTKIAKREEDQLNEREKLIETAARNEAIKRFARLASEKFDNPIAPPEDIFTTLQNLMEPIKETIVLESRANNEMESELKKLDEIWKWLLVNKVDSSSHQLPEQTNS
ncbi:MAG TPA: SPFH domain-containing protein [Anaerolineales bacterium]|nr:SPFH domain-containing protein [Anaerolineales bacterium]HNC09306.1 SPFH domain-containing protein [Anaerolineales bacterium]